MTTKQLLALGLDANAIEYRVRVGRLIRVHHGVYAVGHLPTTPSDRAHGALLAGGPHARGLAGRTALALWRNDRDWPDALELISARDIGSTGIRVTRSSKPAASATSARVAGPARRRAPPAPRSTSRPRDSTATS